MPTPETTSGAVELASKAATAFGIIAAGWSQYQKYRAKAKAEGEEEADPKGPRKEPCADVIATLARVEHENERLCRSVDAANDRADRADARALLLQNALDARLGSGKEPPP